MPALPPGLNEWLPSGATIGFGIFLFGVVRADLKASEARQREEMRELRADMKALGENVDRLVERMLTAKKSWSYPGASVLSSEKPVLKGVLASGGQEGRGLGQSLVQ
ncbi:MAG: hypothetical protein F4226_01060 [Synechococcus sp. SB0678_bin_12]|nr:hypothetical protein [Synechococcus sp. SB0678_bin_12]MYI87461.1 hypothetical protein [Synechococcus sp. SB0672_bin_10]